MSIDCDDDQVPQPAGLAIGRSKLEWKAFEDGKTSPGTTHFQVILIPETEKGAFCEGANELFAYLQDNTEPDQVSISIGDEGYREWHRHSGVLCLGTFVVSAVFVPVLTSLLANYIYGKLSAKRSDQVQFKLHVQRGSKDSISMEYDGRVGELEQALSRVNEISRDNAD